MPDWEVRADDPRAADVRQLLERHLEFAKSTTPPEDVHAMEIEELAEPGVEFFSLRAGGRVLGVGALKRLDDDHAEIKSMHTAEEARGRGVARAMLGHLLETARDGGFKRVSLETGSGDPFTPARTLYESAGFKPCDPFATYGQSPNSAYMTLELSD
jgi:putative acetyltransferase